MKPLKPATPIRPPWTKFYSDMAHLNQPMEEVRKVYDDLLNDPMWMNDLYVVTVRDFADGNTHLSIRRQDRGVCRDWRHFQQIKNQLCGPEREAVELYPAESRVVDTANQFHLWVFKEGYVLPVGFPKGLRDSRSGVHTKIKQRPHELEDDDANRTGEV